ncbi:MAG: M48 family metallopeptidase [Nitrospira sp.]|nr:M48 family metallopeptidase [Nitrospira sp.]
MARETTRPHRNVFLALLMGLLAAGASCATNPYTERSQLILLPASYEDKLGDQAYAQVLKDPKVRISQDPQEVDPVKRVAARIIAAAKQSKYAEAANRFHWDVTVIKDDKTANAFALPGGKIAVYTGIFPMAKNEAGLAMVLGHEVIHALARHGAERMSQGMVTDIVLKGADVALQTQGVAAPMRSGVMQALGLGTQVGVLFPFSRAHESEADHVGMRIAAQAGYDPHEAVHVWERMQQAGGAQPSEYLSTHPSHGTRIKQLEAWMPEALTDYAQASRAPAANLPTLQGR